MKRLYLRISNKEDSTLPFLGDDNAFTLGSMTSGHVLYQKIK